MEHKNWAKEFMNEKALDIDRYFEITNSIFGAIGLGLAITSVTSDNPKFFGTICLIFVAYLWGMSIRKYKSSIRMLKEADHESSTLLNMIKNTLPAIISMFILGGVAVGYVTTTGFCL